MKQSHEGLQREIHALYAAEHAALGEGGTIDRLARGHDLSRQFRLDRTLAEGGVLVFPHAGVAECGHQIAACVQAALDSGSDRVIVLSVLHAFTDAMDTARIEVNKGADPANYPFWGIQGPGAAPIGNVERQEWKGDHALISWRHFWNTEIARRGIQASRKAPQVIERYAYLAGGHPERLPGYEDLARLAEDAVLVTTADPFHHGIGYGHSPAEALYPEQGGLAAARKSIETGIALLEKADYWAYNQQCARDKSDARDTGQLYRHLRGPMTGTIRDLTWSDATQLYHTPPPTWVATALIEWKKSESH